MEAAGRVGRESLVPGSFARGQYELLERIGRGATGSVYRARDRVGDSAREVCIKRLSAQLSPEHARALREEARLLAQVRHSNVVSLLRLGEEDCGAPFLVLELVLGFDLAALGRTLARLPAASWAGLMPDRVAVFVVCGILRGLAAVQRRLPGLVHRDVTPHNVLISNEGEVKLTDFGIALALDRARWTRPTVVKGKLGYMAPEQIRGEALDVRTDLFAVGVILYELLSRQRPGGPGGGMAELRAVEQGDMRPLALHRPGLDRNLLVLVEGLLAWRPADRPRSADDALRALAPFSAGELGSLRLAALTRAARLESDAPPLPAEPATRVDASHAGDGDLPSWKSH